MEGTAKVLVAEGKGILDSYIDELERESVGASEPAHRSDWRDD
jgi:hypothetical protein